MRKAWASLRVIWFTRTMPGVRPGGRPTFLGAQEGGPSNRPSEAARRYAPGSLRCSKPEAAPNSLRALTAATLRQGARNQSLMRAAHAPRSSALLSDFKGDLRFSAIGGQSLRRGSSSAEFQSQLLPGAVVNLQMARSSGVCETLSTLPCGLPMAPASGATNG